MRDATLAPRSRSHSTAHQSATGVAGVGRSFILVGEGDWKMSRLLRQRDECPCSRSLRTVRCRVTAGFVVSEGLFYAVESNVPGSPTRPPYYFLQQRAGKVCVLSSESGLMGLARATRFRSSCHLGEPSLVMRSTTSTGSPPGGKGATFGVALPILANWCAVTRGEWLLQGRCCDVPFSSP